MNKDERQSLDSSDVAAVDQATAEPIHKKAEGKATRLPKPNSETSEDWAALSLSPHEYRNYKGPNKKQLLRWAFSGADQEQGPLRINREDQLQRVIEALLAHMNDAWEENWPAPVGVAVLAMLPAAVVAPVSAREAVLEEAEPSDEMAAAHPSELCRMDASKRFVWVSRKAAEGAHSHLGKYVHPSAKERWSQRVGGDRLLFLTSKSAGLGVRWFSVGFAHAPAFTEPGFIFCANMEVVAGEGQEEVACLGSLLAKRDPNVSRILAAAGISAEAVREAEEIWAAAFSNVAVENTRALPTVLWPKMRSGKWDYDALTSMPALAVYNAMRKMERQAGQMEERLRSSRFSVGSGQAQNISVASTHTGGAIPVLMCEPPRIAMNQGIRLAARTHWGKGVLERVDQEFFKEMEAAGASMAKWPNKSRAQRMKVWARRHINVALSPLFDLRDALEVAPELVERVSAKASQQIKEALLGVGVRKEDKLFWVGLLGSPDLSRALAAHDPADRDAYQDGLWREVVSGFGVNKDKRD